MEIDLGTCDIVLDGDPASPLQGTQPPNFRPMTVVAQWLDGFKMPFGMEVCLSPGDFVLDGDPASALPPKGHSPPFRPMSIVAKRLGGSRCHLVLRYGLGSGDIVLDGTQLPLPLSGQTIAHLSNWWAVFLHSTMAVKLTRQQAR